MLLATVLALSAAGLHATWNLLLKQAPSAERDLTSWGLFTVGGLLGIPVLAITGGPGWSVAGWIVLSAMVHTAYVLVLTSAYRHGDFSLAYPLARGGGALVAALGGVALLGDSLAALAWVAVLVVAVGLLSLVDRGLPALALRDALLTALAIGSYTLIDAHGARLASSPVAYGFSSGLATAVGLAIVLGLRGRGPAVRAALPAAWKTWAVAGACTAGAYTLVLIAMTRAPVGYVAMLRESSVVVGAAMGWLVLREPLGGRRLVSSAVVLCGLVGLVATTL